MPATRLHITRWVDPVVEAEGYAPLHPYVEFFWLPILGPSATVLLWRLQFELRVEPDGCAVNLDELSRDLGLGTSESKHAPLPRAIARLVHFGLAKRLAAGQLAVRYSVGPISEQQLRGLSAQLQMLHRLVLSRAEKAGDPGPPASEPSPTADQKAG
jgi:hypothetical protein